MGTPCEIRLQGKSRIAANRLARVVIADVNRLEEKYSRYRADSLLSKINGIAEQGGAISVDEETAGLLDYAETCYQSSDGLFDISSGLLRHIWRKDLGQKPEASAFDKVLPRIGWDKLRWQKPLLTFTTPGMELDFGGVVKEYAVDRAAALCREHGFAHGFINLGGDLQLLGPQADGAPWQVGIRHPRRDGALLTLPLRHGALASSGDYERCLMLDGQRYGHILNPKTGWPVAYLAQVTVHAPLCVVAGSFATMAMLKEQDGVAFLAESGLDYFYVTVDGATGGTLPA